MIKRFARTKHKIYQKGKIALKKVRGNLEVFLNNRAIQYFMNVSKDSFNLTTMTAKTNGKSIL